MRPSSFPIAALTVTLGLSLAGPALACREYVYPQALREPHDAAVLVRVQSSAFEGDQTRFYTWRAKARLERVLSGRPDASDFTFAGGWQSAGCERTKPPPPGELWVLYLRKSANGWTQTESYPLEVARRIDPTLTGF